jgi:hypothetical protein
MELKKKILNTLEAEAAYSKGYYMKELGFSSSIFRHFEDFVNSMINFFDGEPDDETLSEKVYFYLLGAMDAALKAAKMTEEERNIFPKMIQMLLVGMSEVQFN